MKKLMMASALLGTLCFGTFAVAGDLKIVSGECKLETSAEIIQLKNMNPLEHYGMFAEGFSSKRDRIYLTQNHPNAVDINIQSNGHDSYSIIPLSSTGATAVKVGTLVQNSAAESEWLSCDLLVQ